MASSNVNVADFVSVKPTLPYRKKYKIWKEQMLCLVESQGLLGYIDGKTPPPPENAAAEEQKVWRRRDRRVKGWILGSIGEDALDAVVVLDTAMNVWLELEKIFSEKSDKSDDIDGSEVEVKSTSPPSEDGKGFKWNLPLYRAALKGDWDTAEKMFIKDRDETKAIISSRLETALHVSVGTGKANNFVKNLVEWMPKEALGMQNHDGDTGLHYAAMVGNKEAVEILVNRDPDLQYITNKKDRLPVQLAAIYSHKDTLMYFISMSRPDVERSPFVGKLGVRLLIAVIASEFFDVALDLVGNYPDLGTLEHNGYSALKTISEMKSVFPSGESFNWWQSLIYSCIPLELPISRSDNTRSIAGDIENHSINAPMSIKSSWFDVTCGRIIPQVKGIADKKLIHQQALELVKCLCQKLESLPHQKASTTYNRSLILAARFGIHEVVEVIIEMFPTCIFTEDSKNDRSNIFLLAARNRFENVFNLIYRMSERKQRFYDSVDSCGNSLMHLCAKLGPPHKLNLVPGAALQMQREIQWFKEMEKFVRPSRRTWKNANDKTPKMLFTEEHQQLKAEGERWMKDTANSCTIAAALIATVVFAAAFTVPGGIATENGMPIFRGNFAFILFAISDAISLFTSITSLLMFLSILTSRYAEEDFLYDLPKRLCIGLVTLFISITFMMAAFSATLYLELVKENRWLLIPVAALACLPVTSFVLLQFPLVVDVMYSTYGPGIFGNKSDPLLY